ncbi:MAG: serine/threonine protein kinase [Gemmatimonadota bacterium]|nr:serine/threonine protein kinase [Gemmatimonadota bacterium]
MIGLTGRYEIEREIGRGGMATVYLARDVRHARRVALKVLSPELGAVLGAERFLAEIRVTANLQHPNLLPLFDSGEVDGHLFYVMPYVDGESLRHKLDREKQLPVAEALRIGVAVADALDYAHRHGVIHRDLKPENILLHEGQPLVADFGIALAISNAGGERITQTGFSLGTPQYMSPEQATGDRTVDGRSDIYSLGAVLYEALAGEPPHMGGTVQAVIAKILTETPPSVRVRRPTVHQHVASAIARALEKLPADRWATAREFAAALQSAPEMLPSGIMTADSLAVQQPAQGAAATLVGNLVSRRAWVWAAATVAVATTSWFVAGAFRDDGPPLPKTPVVVLMDSPHPQRVYDPATLRAGGMNADDLTELLRDQPLVLVKEATGSRWDREEQLLSQTPDLIVAHRSTFYDATLLGDSTLDNKYFAQLYAPAADKFESLLGYVARANRHTRFIVYSRGSWKTEADARAWIGTVERRFPAITGRLTVYKVPLDRATFRNETTGGEIKALALDVLRKAGRLSSSTPPR